MFQGSRILIVPVTVSLIAMNEHMALGSLISGVWVFDGVLAFLIKEGTVVSAAVRSFPPLLPVLNTDLVSEAMAAIF